MTETRKVVLGPGAKGEPEPKAEAPAAPAPFETKKKEDA